MPTYSPGRSKHAMSVVLQVLQRQANLEEVMRLKNAFFGAHHQLRSAIIPRERQRRERGKGAGGGRGVEIFGFPYYRLLEKYPKFDIRKTKSTHYAHSLGPNFNRESRTEKVYFLATSPAQV